MAKQLLVVHGMGQHDAASITQAVVSACETAFALYASLRGVSVGEKIDVVPVVYGDLFDDQRQRFANQAAPIATLLGQIPGSLPLAAKAVDEIAEIESRLGRDDFFATHWLDVLPICVNPSGCAVADLVEADPQLLGSVGAGLTIEHYRPNRGWSLGTPGTCTERHSPRTRISRLCPR